MSHLKRPLDGQDPDYEDNTSHEAKRLRILERNAKAEFSHKASVIIQREFNEELSNKEKEIFEIEERLQQAQKTLHLLRYAIVSAFYSKKQNQGTSVPDEKHQRIHPAVKKLIGKQPPKWEPLQQRPSKYRPMTSSSNSTEWGQGSADTSKSIFLTSDTIPGPSSISTDTSSRLQMNISDTKQAQSSASDKQDGTKDTVTKVPRYIPPKTGPKSIPVYPVNDTRGMRHKIKKRLVIGNISKWVPVDTREDAASHKWMMYVRGPKESPDISGFVSKVRFFLHPSYRPHDIAEVTSPPFHLSKRGWGEFPVRVQIHFCHPRNKPVDVIHHLKLDRTYTGLQTLGAETVVDIWLHTGSQENGHCEEETSIELVNGISAKNQDKNLDLPSSLLSSNGSSSTITTASDTSITSDDNARTISPIKPKVEPELEPHSYAMNETVNNHPPSVSASCVKRTTITPASSLDHDYIGCVSLLNTSVDSSIFSDKNDEFKTLQKSAETLSPMSQNSEASDEAKDMPELEESVENTSYIKQNSSSCLKEKITYNESSNLGASKVCSSAELHATASHNLDDNMKHKNEEKATKKLGSSISQHPHSSIVSLPNHLTAATAPTQFEGNNHAVATKLTTLVKCMDKSGHVFYITLGRANLKQQVKSGNTSAGLPQESTSSGKPPPLLGPTSLLIPKDKQPKQEQSQQQLETANTLLHNTSTPLMTNSNSVLLPRTDVKTFITQKATNITPGQGPVKKTLLTSSNFLTHAKQKHVFRYSNIPATASSVTESSNAVDSGLIASKTVQGNSTNTIAPVRMVTTNQSLVGNNLGQACVVSKVQSEKQANDSASEEKKVTNTQVQLAAVEEQRTLIIKDGQFYIVKHPQVPIPSNTAQQNPSVSEASKKAQKLTVAMENSKQIQVPLDASTITKIKSQAPATGTMNSIVTSQSGVNVIRTLENSSVVSSSSSSTNIWKTKLTGAPNISQTIRSGSSLLKKSVNSSNIAPTSVKLVPKEENTLKLKAKEDIRFLLSGRTLVLNKANSKNMNNSRKSKFEEELRNAVTKCNFASMSQCVRWLLQHMPLVTPLACIPDYKVLHPYAAPDRETFLHWNIGKRRAAEWCRAKAVQKALLTSGQYKETKVWSTHAIAVWAKLHGYTPLPAPSNKEVSKQQEQQKQKKQQQLPTTYSEPVKIMDWLVSTNHNSDLNSSAEIDLELDVVSLGSPERKVRGMKEESAAKAEELNSEALVLEINDPNIEAECLHVRETARELGFKLLPEEIIPGVLVGAAERIIVQAVRSLVDDLLRRSLCKAMKRNSNSYPEIIMEEDLKAVLLSRSEFDIFTNSGLGVQVADIS